MDADLTLEKAKKMIRQKEAVKEQSQELDGETQKEEAALEELRQKHTKPPPPNRKGGASGLPKTLFAHDVVAADINGVRDAQLTARFATAVAGGAIVVPNAFLQTVHRKQAWIQPFWTQ